MYAISDADRYVLDDFEARRPIQLYRYVRLDGERFDWFLRMVVEGEVHFPQFRELNDPFEGRVQLDFSGTPAEIRDYWIRSRAQEGLPLDDKALGIIEEFVRRAEEPGFQAELAEELRRALLEYGVWSLTESADDELMWQRYGGEGRGACIRIDPLRLFIPEREGLTPPVAVAYVPHLPTPSYYRETEFKRMLALMATKTNHWEREREWRVINTRGFGPTKFNHHALDAVFLGRGVVDDDLRRIEEMKSQLPGWVGVHRLS